MNDALSAMLLLLVLLLAWRVLWRVGLVALFLIWPSLTVYIALLDTRPPGFGGWVLFLVVALSVAIPGALLWVWMRRSRSACEPQLEIETACREPDAWPDSAGSRAAIRLHLIPGTWASGFFVPWLPRRRARGAYWFEQGSAFRCALLDSLGATSRVYFTSLPWSERNSMRARTVAAKTFASLLKAELDDHPDAQHFVVAHSHGGNIALSALQDLTPEERGRISGLVTMGTPFLWFEPLEAGLAAQLVVFLARLLVPVYVALGVIGAATLVGVLPLVQFGLVPGWLNSWPFYILALAIVLAISRHEYKKTDDIHELVLTFRAQQSDNNLPPMLVLRSPDDEASRGMRGGQTTARLLLVVWTLFDTLFKAGKAWWRIALVLIAALVVGALQNAGWPNVSGTAVIMALRNPMDTFYGGLIVLYIGGTLAAIAFSTLASIPLAIALGPELLRLPLLVKPVVEDMPTNVCVRAMNLPGSGFRHQVYARPEAVEQVAAFVNEKRGLA